MGRIAVLMAIISLPVLGQALADEGAESWAHLKALHAEAASAARAAGHDGDEVYRRGMQSACAKERFQLKGEARAKADADCAAIEKPPRLVVPECNPGVICPAAAEAAQDAKQKGKEDH